nr:hypothetical protein [Tanacetum cinerariifolium]
IHYALTVSPHIYISCIKQFWNSVLVKCSGDVTSQWKFLIHTILQSLSAKRTSWNEFSTAMASAVICLSKGVETPLFKGMIGDRQPAEEELGAEQVQVDAAAAVEDVAEDVVHMATPSPPPHGISYPPQEPSSPPHQPPCPPQLQDAEGSSLLFQHVLDTCSDLAHRDDGIELVADQDKDAEVERRHADKQADLYNLDQGHSSKVLSMQEDDTELRGRHADKQADLYNLDQGHSSKVLSMQEDDTEVQEAVEIVTTAKLMTEVVTAAATQVVAASTPIPAAKPKILNIVVAPAVSTRRRKGVVIRDSEEELPSDTLAETPKVKDIGKGILIEAPKPMKKKDQIELDAEYARKL